MFLKPMTEEQLNYEGFFDGQNKTIPDNTELKFEVVDCFHGMNDQGLMACYVNLKIVEGEFAGQLYKYNAKLWDMNAQKRDKSATNLSVLDAQAGLPMTTHQIPLSTESMNQYWAGLTEGENGDLIQTGKPVRARLKMQLMLSTEDFNGNKHLDENGDETTQPINWISGFAYSREDMVKPNKPQQQASPVETATTEPPFEVETPDDIDF